MPLVSEALAVILRFEPAVYELPFDGLVMETVGDDGEVTLTVIAPEDVETPLASVALAVIV